METIEIQALERKEDLELLVEGDKVDVELQHVKGIVTFLHNDDGVLRFIKRDNGRILKYYVEEWDVNVKDNKIIQKKDRTYGNPEVFEKDSSHYGIYDKIIGETD